MSDFQNRLKQAVDRSGRSPRNISLSAGLSPGTISELLKDEDRSPSVENLQAIARELGTSFLWLAEGARGNERATGFSENDVTPYAPPTRHGQLRDRQPDNTTLQETLAPSARKPATFVSRIAAPLFGMLAGDVLVIDLNGTARDGDLVLATVADLNTGSATTLVRKLATPYLLSPHPQETGSPLVADGHRTVIMGPIVAIARGRDLKVA